MLQELSGLPLFSELEIRGSYKDSSAWIGRQGRVWPLGVLVIHYGFKWIPVLSVGVFNLRGCWALLILSLRSRANSDFVGF